MIFITRGVTECDMAVNVNIDVATNTDVNMAIVMATDINVNMATNLVVDIPYSERYS
jgi:hypothetical protein